MLRVAQSRLALRLAQGLELAETAAHLIELVVGLEHWCGARGTRATNL